ncbi:KPN_02809 family neutral zinc metallopeptidase [Stratiformator vulcanicus]|uniref:Neutral zinc metallopeptidase n=1 Tax=Stratiformator vulcanicus TaxID=2527980 RepID=A0A517QY76_9PLAN|nr:neutral zinc metallopeptidase [Stratiformator vulcanicus]QDT36619.1 Putative neutral zinc metallopeptidase [Stratiformator vulcanicus]
MRWRGRRGSKNIEDRRGRRAPMATAGLGGGGLLIIVIILFLLGVDPGQILRVVANNAGPRPQVNQPVGNDKVNEERAKFVSVVLADTEEVWAEQFQQLGRKYSEPELVLFNGAVKSACGLNSSAVGPFYCPADHHVYIDLSFYDDLSKKLGAPGDFAQAYVVAHEVGHHVQNLLGLSDRLNRARGRVSEEELNELTVRMELQADFLAGVWAHHAQKNWDILEPGDVQEALRAAAAIGDDRLQMKSQGYVVPESFTHGTSEQRVRWFRRGFETGDITQGDTFNTNDL